MGSPPLTQGLPALQQEASTVLPIGHMRSHAFTQQELVPEGMGASSSRATSAESPSRLPHRRSAGVRKSSQRQAPERVRQRSRARADDLEQQVAAAEAELEELEASQRQLEARNAVLETFTSLSLTPAASQNLLQQNVQQEQQGGGDLITIAADAQTTVILTILNDQQQPRTAQEVGSMAADEFCMLYTAYAHKIGQCLAATSQHPSGAAATLLRKWTCEQSTLRVFLAMASLKNYLFFTSIRLDSTPGPTAPQLSEAWYLELLGALELTEEQQRDVLHLRKLFYAKLGTLARERTAMLGQVPTGAAETAASTSNQLGQVADTAQRLQDNSTAELKTYMQFSSAFGRGILTIKQQAVGVVKAFPYIPEQPRLFEALAGLHDEQPIRVLTQAANFDDAQHHHRWQGVVAYLGRVTGANLHEHVPILMNEG